MKLWNIWQNVNNNYDTYSEAVVAAKDEETARNTHPDGCSDKDNWDTGNWARSSKVQVSLIGNSVIGMKAGVICASYHAG